MLSMQGTTVEAQFQVTTEIVVMISAVAGNVGTRFPQ
jgi:hypothetical protein